MQDDIASPALIRLMSAELRGTEITPARSIELADDLRRILGAARAEARNNDFNDEPSKFLVILNRLAADGLE